MRRGLVMGGNERNHAEDSRILIAHALNSVREIVTISDLDDRFTFVNQAFLDAFGYTRDEVLGQHVSLIGSPNNPAGLHAKIFAQSRLGGWKGELLNRTKAGREIPIALSTSCIRDGSGKILGLIGIAEDITLRRQAAEALVARTKQIEGIRANSEEISRELDLATVLTLIIQRAAELTGAGSGMVYLWDEEAQVLLPAAWHGGGSGGKNCASVPGKGWRARSPCAARAWWSTTIGPPRLPMRSRSSTARSAPSWGSPCYAAMPLWG